MHGVEPLVLRRVHFLVFGNVMIHYLLFGMFDLFDNCHHPFVTKRGKDLETMCLTNNFL